MDVQSLAALAQLGFAAAMAFLLFKALTDLFPKILEAMQQSSETLTNLTRAIDEHIRQSDRRMDDLDGRVSHLERHPERHHERHNQAGRNER